MYCETDMLRVSGIRCVILYPKKMWYYITYDGPTKVQKTRGWSPTPFPRCTLGSSGPNQSNGLGDQNRSRYILIYSSQIFTYMLFKYIETYSQNYSSPGCVPSVWPKVSFRTDDPRLTESNIFTRSLPHLEILGAKVIGTRTHNTKMKKLVYWCTIWPQIMYIK